MSGITNVY